jgi:Bacteriophage holin family
MKVQLAILLSSIQKSSLQLLAVISAFFLPITGILFLIGFAILVDTLTGIWKAKKLKLAITSRRLSAIISKLMLYEVAVIGFYLIDKFILNDIILTFFSVPLMLTKILSLVLVSIEVISISENYKAVKGIDIWSAFKNLLQRSKEIKSDIDGVRYNKDSSTPSI